MHLSRLSDGLNGSGADPVPISVTTFVTCSNSMPEKPVELMVSPENPGYVSDRQNNCGAPSYH
jgi:hypothetical protein